MREPQAYFFDLDGTSYYHKYHDVMPSTLKAWRALKAKGYRVCVATSRCPKEMGNFREEVRSFPFDAIISDGGALIRQNQQVIHSLPISKESMRIIDDYCKKHDLMYRYSTLEGDYFSKECAVDIKAVYFQLYLNVPGVKAYEESDEVYNILLYLPNQKMQEELGKRLSDCAFTDHESVLEVTNHLANKTTGIDWLCSYWNLEKADTMVFGDGFNDVAMIQNAGIGVAMGNGVQACKDVADYVCENIEDDGIYRLLCELHIIEEEV